MHCCVCVCVRCLPQINVTELEVWLRSAETDTESAKRYKPPLKAGSLTGKSPRPPNGKADGHSGAQGGKRVGWQSDRASEGVEGDGSHQSPGRGIGSSHGAGGTRPDIPHRPPLHVRSPAGLHALPVPPLDYCAALGRPAPEPFPERNDIGSITEGYLRFWNTHARLRRSPRLPPVLSPRASARSASGVLVDRLPRLSNAHTHFPAGAAGGSLHSYSSRATERFSPRRMPKDFVF